MQKKTCFSIQKDCLAGLLRNRQLDLSGCTKIALLSLSFVLVQAKMEEIRKSDIAHVCLNPNASEVTNQRTRIHVRCMIVCRVCLWRCACRTGCNSASVYLTESTINIPKGICIHAAARLWQLELNQQCCPPPARKKAAGFVSSCRGVQQAGSHLQPSDYPALATPFDYTAAAVRRCRSVGLHTAAGSCNASALMPMLMLRALAGR